MGDLSPRKFQILSATIFSVTSVTCFSGKFFKICFRKPVLRHIVSLPTQKDRRYYKCCFCWTCVEIYCLIDLSNIKVQINFVLYDFLAKSLFVFYWNRYYKKLTFCQTFIPSHRWKQSGTLGSAMLKFKRLKYKMKNFQNFGVIREIIVFRVDKICTSTYRELN